MIISLCPQFYITFDHFRVIPGNIISTHMNEQHVTVSRRLSGCQWLFHNVRHQTGSTVGSQYLAKMSLYPLLERDISPLFSFWSNLEIQIPYSKGFLLLCYQSLGLYSWPANSLAVESVVWSSDSTILESNWNCSMTNYTLHSTFGPGMQSYSASSFLCLSWLFAHLDRSRSALQ